MFNNKISPPVQLALRYENLLTAETRSLFQDAEDPQKWHLIVKYTQSLEGATQRLGLHVFLINEQFALVTIDKQNITRLSDEGNVIYITFSQVFSYINQSLNEICMTNVIQASGNYRVTGKGILVGIVDTGIDYSHPDFIMANGKSRIRFLWDQTLPGKPPMGFETGTEYTNGEINAALAQPEKSEQLALVPSQDTLGHGTVLAGVAAGNGRGSGGRNRGVASESELLIVKLGQEGTDSNRPITREILLGIRYVIEKAKELNQPIVILLGIGTSIGGHDGTAVLEQYLEQVAETWSCNFVVGTGNQGDKGGHTSGQIREEEEVDIQLLIEQPKQNYQCGVWKQFIDEVQVVIESPQGERTESLGILTPNRVYFFNNTIVLVNISEPSIDILKQVVSIYFEAQTEEGINTGIWHIRLTGIRVLEGSYNAWGQINADPLDRTRFLKADSEKTLTIPSTTMAITSVGAFSSSISQVAAFSGRGFTGDERVKPDLVAPGVNVLAPSIKPDVLYEEVSGTSVSAAFVAGAYALLMEYGILQLGLPYLYGDTLKIYLLTTAQRPITYSPFPNSAWGYGSLCVEEALNRISEVNATST